MGPFLMPCGMLLVCHVSICNIHVCHVSICNIHICDISICVISAYGDEAPCL